MSMSNNEQGNGISIQISNGAVEKISQTILGWREVQSKDLVKVLETMERVGDKCLGVVTSIEMARQARRPEVHIVEKPTKG